MTRRGGAAPSEVWDENVVSWSTLVTANPDIQHLVSRRRINEIHLTWAGAGDALVFCLGPVINEPIELFRHCLRSGGGEIGAVVAVRLPLCRGNVVAQCGEQ